MSRMVLPILTESGDAKQAGTEPDVSQLQTVIVKVTSRCNIRCKYCYEHLSPSSDMAAEVFMRVARRAITATESPSVDFIFHGGEPTLVGEEWYRDVLPLAQALGAEKQKRVSFGIQSNGINLSDGFLDLFSRFDVKLGLSIDGPSLDRPMRPLLREAVATYRRAIARGLEPGVLMTINQQNAQCFATLYSWLRDELNVSLFKANPVASVGHGIGLSPLSSGALLEAQLTLLECMLLNPTYGPIEENLARELMRFFNYAPAFVGSSVCHGHRCGAGSTVIGVAPDGSALPCGRFAWDDDAYKIGTFANTGVEAPPGALTDYHSILGRFHEIAPENWTECTRCEASAMCAKGCQAFIARSNRRRNEECAPTRARFAYYTVHRERLEPLVRIIAERWGDRRFVETMASGAGYDDFSYSDYSDARGFARTAVSGRRD